MAGHAHQTDSRFAFKDLSPRRRRMYRRRIITAMMMIAAAVVIGCILHIDETCSLGLEPLPEAAYSNTVITEPVKPEYPLYDIPLSDDLQRFTYERCLEWDVDPIMVYAIMAVESDYRSDLISDTGDYGIMQINADNLDYLFETLGTTNPMDPEQNIEAGIFWLSGICKNNSDPERILMVYNMGGTIAQALWDQGRESTWYSREVLRTMDEIRERRELI